MRKTRDPIEELFQHHIEHCHPADETSPDWFCGFAAALSLIDEGIKAGSQVDERIIIAILAGAMRLRARVSMRASLAVN